MRPRRDARGRRRGYSLPELLLGAAVIAAFLVRIYQSYSATQDSDRYEDFVSQLTLMSAQTVANAQIGADYSTVSNLEISGTLPIKMIKSVSSTDAELTTSYHQPIRIKPIDTTLTGVTTTASGIEIHATIPESACFRLAMAGPQIFEYMATTADGTGEQSFPFTNVQAEALCGSAGGTAMRDVWLFVVPSPVSTIATR